MKSSITQAEINREIKEAEKEEQFFFAGIYRQDKELIELKNSIESRRKEIAKDAVPKLEDVRSRLKILRSDLEYIKKQKVVGIPEDLQDWWKSYNSGIDWGYNGLKIRWISDDHRFVIITNPGSTAGTGTVMGSLAYYYAATDHWIADTQKKADGISNRFCVMDGDRFGGRLTKVRMNYMKHLCSLVSAGKLDSIPPYDGHESGEYTLEEWTNLILRQ